MRCEVWRKSLVAVGAGLLLVAASPDHQTEPHFPQGVLQHGTFTDERDGTTYGWVQVGSQAWMAENLNFRTPSGWWCYEDDGRRCEEFGRLYDWPTALTACPAGWHLPSDEEWATLESALGPDPGTRLKVGGDAGFAAKMAGVRLYSGEYYALGASTHFWTSTPIGGETSDHSLERGLFRDQPGVLRDGFGHIGGVSVRCLRDQPAR